MPITFVPLATTTINSPTSEITFNSIPNTYTDLRIVFRLQVISPNNCWIRFNGDTSTSSYPQVSMASSGADTSSTLQTAQNFIRLDYGAGSTPNYGLAVIDVLNYAGSTFKNVMSTYSGDDNSSNGPNNKVIAYWASTNAINSVTCGINGTNNLQAGTTAAIYGILKA
jgi:hypothetical protein